MVCARCGKENHAHYKFCLGCGAELDDVPPTKPAPAPKRSSAGAATVMAEAPQRARAATPAPVFEEMAPADSGPVAVPSGESRLCTTCSTMVAPGYRFCPTCGSPVAQVAGNIRHTGAIAPMKEAQAGQLVLIRPDGSEGGTHPLKDGENLIGRSAGPLFEADGYLSPVHAELVLNAAGLVVRDTNSLNGVFVKIADEEEIFDGDIFRIGQELLRFDVIGAPEPLEDGTEILGSPNPGYWGRLAVVVGKEQDSSAFSLMGDAVILGRERGDITFPEDGYVSGMHARVSLHDGRFWLADLNSSNGTFLRVRGERPVPRGAFILMGQQLFRVTY